MPKWANRSRFAHLYEWAPILIGAGKRPRRAALKRVPRLMPSTEHSWLALTYSGRAARPDVVKTGLDSMKTPLHAGGSMTNGGRFSYATCCKYKYTTCKSGLLVLAKNRFRLSIGGSVIYCFELAGWQTASFCFLVKNSSTRLSPISISLTYLCKFANI